MSATLRVHGGREAARLHGTNVRVLRVDESRADTIIMAFRQNAGIEFAERDAIAEAVMLPNDPLLVSGQEWHVSRIAAPQAWNITVGSPDVIVALLDSGIAANHPEFTGRLLAGYDFVGNGNNPEDDFGHGTAVAGVIAANGNNGIGVAGIAYGCLLLPVKVVDSSGFAAYSAVAQGIHFAVDQGARIINLSIAGSSSSFTLQDAINYAWERNVLVVAAAGNDGTAEPQYPAACDHVLAVGATEPDDSRAWFSNYGSHISLSAPGDALWTTQRDSANPYGPWRGTSFASPVVAGVAALVASANPTLSNTQLASILEQTADDLGTPGVDALFGYGRVNAFRAVAMAAPGLLDPGTNTVPAEMAPESVGPSLKLTRAPANGARLYSPSVALAGVASDNAGLGQVQLSLNGQEYQPVTGLGNWTAQVFLAPGTNNVRLRAVNAAGNASPEIVRSWFYSVTAPLTIQTAGVGTVGPHQNGAMLEIGRTYAVRAVPGSGQLFAGWEGWNCDSPLLRVTMRSNLVLTAKFVPSPFVPVKGTYSGLVAGTNGVSPENSASFSMTVTGLGLFSGRLLLAGHRYGFRGQFNLAGEATVSVPRSSAAPLALRLKISLTDGSGQVRGSLDDGVWVAQLSGDLNVFNARLNPARQAGVRHFLLERAGQVATTAATGVGRISLAGAASVRGRLIDGRPFASASTLSQAGDYPFYLSLNRGTEVVIGWLNFPAGGNSTASGTVLWIKSGTNSFAATLQAKGL